MKLWNVGGGGCGRLKILNAGGGGGGGGNIGGIKLLNVGGDGGGEKLLLLLLLFFLLLKNNLFLKHLALFVCHRLNLVLVPFQQGHSQCLFCQYQVLLAKSRWQDFVHQMLKCLEKQVQEDFASKKYSLILDLQPDTKYLRLTLVFMLSSTLREKFNFCFSRIFC